ncbi:MAG TPA: antitoxin [Phycicoccus sp.]|jgi:hypothetical protein|nr:antitoxin [Phycicoccus sp.]HQH07590.1 antitoxin [Phycicoccus sp.]HQK32242.1 antitoxin [Phycicoccus sp.]HQV91787.1 antitoxin [Phycicoccus sp.]HRA46037.1 antitoxin [Phycicoccus sp.]
MADLLIRNFPADDLRLLDEQAAHLGLSRAEHLRRQLVREARRAAAPVSASDLRAVGDLLSDLADDDVMSDAWS